MPIIQAVDAPVIPRAEILLTIVELQIGENWRMGTDKISFTIGNIGMFR